ncbi:MAG: chromosomal replication initiator protein DnaA [Lachnospiraceae bacterium]|nr:chromosomal replication initiator protein DnaA [Lachnospiraceae bacterium]
MFELLQNKWNDILNIMQQEYDISDVSFKTWLLPLKLYSIKDDTITILVEDTMGVSYITKKFSKMFKVTITEVLGQPFEISFISEKDINTSDKPFTDEQRQRNSQFNDRITEANLNPKYTFDTFVVGGSNSFAHAYALKVAESPAEEVNPLFLYGGVGLGKTHLMHSIAHYILEHNENMKVLYVTSEAFTNELINIIRNDSQRVNDFRNKYRNIDVLLIDDIQFIIGKDRCQEEFFHTFNTLYESKKQIVISSDKPPKEMTTLEERLRTRFECGLAVDISSPEYETRMAILQKKTQIEGNDIDNDILDYIASNIVSNIRELEGAFNKVVAYSKISPLKMNLDLAKDVLKDTISPDSSSEVTCELITRIVAEHYNITPEDIYSKKKSQNIAIPRQIVMYLSRTLTDESFTNIGSLLGNRDHSTVLYGFEKIKSEIASNENMKNTIEVITKKISPN